MKLIDLSVLLILASYSEGQNWTINVKRHHTVTNGSDLFIPCKFTYPPKAKNGENVTIAAVSWKIFVTGVFECDDIYPGVFISHSNEMCVKEEYRNKTRLTGNAASGDCSIQILDIRDNVTSLFVRVYGKGESYSFYNSQVSITVNAEASETATLMYTSIFVPTAALLIILLVAGIFFWMRHKRSHNFTRKDSGYYANFSRASSDPPKREISDKKDKELPEVKVIDEPVYINVEAPTNEMDQSMDVTENVYANVDYTKK